MFRIGDAVVHPVHGVGTITGISVRSVSGESESYYVVAVSSSKVTLLIPVDRTAGMGLREAPDKAEVEEALSILPSQGEGVSGGFRERQAYASRAISSGGVSELARAYRDLTGYGDQRRLSSWDIGLLERMKCLLGAQVALARGMGLDEANGLVWGIAQGTRARVRHTVRQPGRVW